MTVIATAVQPAVLGQPHRHRPRRPDVHHDTLRDLRALNPDADLFFITGADALAQILTWRDADELFSLRALHRCHPARSHADRPGAARRAVSRSSRFPRWPSRPRTAARGSPRATRSGIWCRTAWCATSTSASCTAASEPRGAPVNDRIRRRVRRRPAGRPAVRARRLRRLRAACVPAGAAATAAVPATAQQQPGQQPYDPYAQQTPQTQGYEQGTATTRTRPGSSRLPRSYDPYGAGNPASRVRPLRAGGEQWAAAPGRRAGGALRCRRARTARAEADRLRPAAAGRSRRERRPAGRRRARVTGTNATTSTEQFAFVEEPDEDSEDVIDWLKFTENRTERREEAKRRAPRPGRRPGRRPRPGGGGRRRLSLVRREAARDVLRGRPRRAVRPPAGPRSATSIVVHLHNTEKGGTSTVLLVDNATTKQGTTVLLPNSLAADRRRRHHDHARQVRRRRRLHRDPRRARHRSSAPTSRAPGGSTPRTCENLVELVGNIDVDTDADVPDPDAKKKGDDAPGEEGRGADPQRPGGRRLRHLPRPRRGRRTRQLERFGQVMQGVLRKLSSDAQAATVTVQTLAQILDPSLTEQGPRRFLARLADLAKGGDYKTALLPVQGDGTLSAQASDARRQGRPRRHRQEPRTRAPRSGSPSRTPAATRATRRRPGSSSSTAASPSWTAVRPTPPAPRPRSPTPTRPTRRRPPRSPRRWACPTSSVKKGTVSLERRRVRGPRPGLRADVLKRTTERTPRARSGCPGCDPVMTWGGVGGP